MAGTLDQDILQDGNKEETAEPTTQDTGRLGGSTSSQLGDQDGVMEVDELDETLEFDDDNVTMDDDDL